MYSVGDTVRYTGNGACVITAVESKQIGKTTALYYALKPLYKDEGNMTIYVPVDGDAGKLEPERVLTRESVLALIDSIPGEAGDPWIENAKERKEHYKTLMSVPDRRALIRLIKTVYLRKLALQEGKKKIPAVDESFLKEAEKTLYNEFAFILGIKREAVLPFIVSRIEGDT
jgi:CarD family transcriptional regulator